VPAGADGAHAPRGARCSSLAEQGEYCSRETKPKLARVAGKPSCHANCRAAVYTLMTGVPLIYLICSPYSPVTASAARQSAADCSSCVLQVKALLSSLPEE